MTNLKLKIAHSVQEIDPQAWDALGQGQPFTSHRWYRWGETVLAEDQPLYIILSQEKKIVARATFWLKKQEPLPLSSPRLRRLVRSLLGRWPLLVCRAPLSASSGLILPPPPLREAALKQITHTAQALAKQYGASFTILDYLTIPQTQWDGWPDHFVPMSGMDPGTYLEITWPDFESYIKARSKSMRKDYRRQRNRAADLDIEITTHAQVKNLEKALTLIRDVEAQHDAPPNPWARAMLENMGMVEATWLQAEIEGQIVGCGLLIGDGGARFLALLGLDYEIKYAYFQLFYAAIRCAIEEKVQILRGGSGAYQLKRRLGFQPEPGNNVVLTVRGKPFQYILRRLAKRWGSE